MRWARLFGRSSDGEAARALYRRIVEQARMPAFYTDCAVPDTVDGRFETIALHLFLVLHRLKDGRSEKQEENNRLAQALFDLMFEDMDENLREMGVGDLSVGRKVKKMAEAVYGRLAAYEHGLEAGRGALESALRRNLYGTLEATPDQLGVVAHYLRREVDSLAAYDYATFQSGKVTFGPPPQAVALASERFEEPSDE